MHVNCVTLEMTKNAVLVFTLKTGHNKTCSSIIYTIKNRHIVSLLINLHRTISIDFKMAYGIKRPKASAASKPKSTLSHFLFVDGTTYHLI
jgi:hypothetical protein